MAWRWSIISLPAGHSSLWWFTGWLWLRKSHLEDTIIFASPRLGNCSKGECSLWYSKSTVKFACTTSSPRQILQEQGCRNEPIDSWDHLNFKHTQSLHQFHSSSSLEKFLFIFELAGLKTKPFAVPSLTLSWPLKIGQVPKWKVCLPSINFQVRFVGNTYRAIFSFCSNYSDLTRPGTPKGSWSEGKSDPYFRKIQIGEILWFGQIFQGVSFFPRAVPFFLAWKVSFVRENQGRLRVRRPVGADFESPLRTFFRLSQVVVWSIFFPDSDSYRGSYFQ